MATETLYVRIGPENMAWLKEQAAMTNLPLSRLTDALISDARRRGAEFSQPTILVREPEQCQG